MLVKEEESLDVLVINSNYFLLFNVPDVDVFLINHTDLFVAVCGEGRVDCANSCYIMGGNPVKLFYPAGSLFQVYRLLFVKNHLVLVLQDQLSIIGLCERNNYFRVLF